MRLIFVVFMMASATAGAAPNAAAMAQSAKKAVAEERYCDALYLFTLAFSIGHEPKHLFNAAEVAYAADDRVKALQLYREVLQRFPSFEKRETVDQRIAEIGQTIATDGVGTACPIGKPLCGNAVVEGSEKCDDGNTVDGDGCDHNCMLTGCGNGVVTVGEACDDGNTIDGDRCTSLCTMPGCGNGHVDSGEVCDDGNLLNGDGCDDNCTETRCGNGVPTKGEACDDGNATDGDGCDGNCTRSACGNGVLVDDDEICDDGNNMNGDGCDSNCTPTGCGNAIVTDPEECDDGNGENADQCTNDCKRSASAAATPPVAAPVEDDGLKAGWIVAASSAALTIAGVITGVAAVLPMVRYQNQIGLQEELEADFERADNDDERSEIAAEAGALHAQLEGDLRFWNDVGQYLAPVSFIAAAVGIAGAAAGTIMATNEGGGAAE